MKVGKEFPEVAHGHARQWLLVLDSSMWANLLLQDALTELCASVGWAGTVGSNRGCLGEDTAASVQ